MREKKQRNRRRDSVKQEETGIDGEWKKEKNERKGKGTETYSYCKVMY